MAVVNFYVNFALLTFRKHFVNITQILGIYSNPHKAKIWRVKYLKFAWWMWSEATPLTSLVDDHATIPLFQCQTGRGR